MWRAPLQRQTKTSLLCPAASPGLQRLPLARDTCMALSLWIESTEGAQTHRLGGWKARGSGAARGKRPAAQSEKRAHAAPAVPPTHKSLHGNSGGGLHSHISTAVARASLPAVQTAHEGPHSLRLQSASFMLPWSRAQIGGADAEEGPQRARVSRRTPQGHC